MTRRPPLPILCCLLLCTTLILPLQALADAIIVEDDTGREVRIVEPAERIVSLAPHVTEILFAAGAGEKIAGAVEHSDYPLEARQLDRVGNYASFDLEAIIALEPDLVVGWDSGNQEAQLDQLQLLGVPVFRSEIRELDDIPANVERLGRLAGTHTRAQEAALTLRGSIDALERQYRDSQPVRVFYQIWHQPPMTVGGNHLISRVIELCGGTNVFGNLAELAPTVNEEAVLSADPQAIIASGSGGKQPEWLASWQQWPTLSAASTNSLFIIPPELIQRPSPRLLKGAQMMCDQLEHARQNLVLR